MRTRVLLFLPLLLAILLMLPRLASPHFGFLDDADTVRTGREFTQSLSTLLGAFSRGGDTGRFLPLYWLYYAGVYLLGWGNPFIYFFANMVALIFTTAAIILFVRFRGGSALQASFAGIFFVLSGPVLETFYTNSKAGVPQVVLLGLLLVLLTAYGEVKTPFQRMLIGLGMFFAFLGADFTMETSVVMAGIAVAWAISARLRLPAAGDRLAGTSTLAMAVAGALSIVTWYSFRVWIGRSAINKGTYTSGYQLSLERLADTGFGWLSYLLRDFLYLPLLIIPMLMLVRRGKQTQTRLIVDCLSWIAISIAIYLPWQSALEYYMLLCSVGLAMLGGIAVGQTFDVLRTDGGRGVQVAAGMAAFVFGIACVNNWTNGRYQLTMDRSNNALADYLSTLPQNSKVLLNIREPSEYEYELGLHVNELRARSDISVDFFRLQTVSPEQRETTYYVATPVVKNELHPSVRYGLYSTGATDWGRVLAAFMGPKDKLVFHVENRIQLLDFGLHRLLCPLVGPQRGLYCNIGRPFIDGRTLIYGWGVYKVVRRIEEVARPGIFSADGMWSLQTTSGAVRQLQFGERGDRPITGDWTGGGSTGIGVFRATNKTWYLDSDLDGKADIIARCEEMQEGDLPLAGDWDGKGKAVPGYFRPRDATWHFMSDFHAPKEELVLHFGSPTDIPLIGDWNGAGRDSIGVYRRETGEFIFQNILAKQTTQFSYRAQAGASPVVGRWSGNGADTVAFVASQRWNMRLVNSASEPSNPPSGFTFGPREGVPVAGRWPR